MVSILIYIEKKKAKKNVVFLSQGIFLLPCHSSRNFPLSKVVLLLLKEGLKKN